jgi:glycosyltransferase involved in cell wall biosynthesis
MKKRKIYIISYFNLKEKLAGGLRANELFKFLNNNGLNVEIITRKQSEGYERIIHDFKIPNILRKVFHLVFPDSSITWVLKLYFFFKNKKDITIIVTSPPHGLIYLSLLLRNQKTIKFIHDFRDPFTLNAHPQKKIFTRKYFNKKIENFITNNVDHIVFNTADHKDMFLKEYPYIKSYSIINNGYIHENFNERNPVKELVYFGGHYSGKIVKVLINFLTTLNQKSNKKYVLDIYGEFHPGYEENNELFNYCGLRKRSELNSLLLNYKIGFVCYTEHYNGRGIATKFFEIIGMGMTPYCINPSKDLINLINEIGVGNYCFQKNIAELDHNYFDNFKSNILDEKTTKKIMIYSRNNQNKKFITLINNL